VGADTEAAADEAAAHEAAEAAEAAATEAAEAAEEVAVAGEAAAAAAAAVAVFGLDLSESVNRRDTCHLFANRRGLTVSSDSGIASNDDPDRDRTFNGGVLTGLLGQAQKVPQATRPLGIQTDDDRRQAVAKFPLRSASHHPRPPSRPVSILACAPSHSPPLRIGVKRWCFLPLGRTPMPRSTPNTQHEKWALASRREMLMAIGQQLRAECELPQELPPALPIRIDKEHDPYADIVGTC
jgi:hypothetical protein